MSHPVYKCYSGSTTGVRRHWRAWKFCPCCHRLPRRDAKLIRARLVRREGKKEVRRLV